MKGKNEKATGKSSTHKWFIEENSYSPAVRDISRQFGITVKAAHDHLKALERKGVIRSTEGISRSTGVVGFSVAQTAETIVVPVLGSTAAGTPILAEENYDGELTFPAKMFATTGPFFARNEGDRWKPASLTAT